MSVDTNSRITEINEDIARIYKILGYRYVINSSLSEPTKIGEVHFIPRVNVSRDELLSSLSKFIKLRNNGVITALIVNDAEDLKEYVKFRKALTIASLSKNALLRLGRRGRDKLVGLKLPVELCIKDIVLSSGKFLKGLQGVINDLIKERIELIITPCPEKPYEIVHPLILESLLITLDVPEDIAIKSVRDVPLRIIEGLGDIE